MIRLIRHIYICTYKTPNLWNLWNENSTENLVLCRSLPQVHENHEDVQGFSKQCSLYHPLWHLRHLMSRLPRFEGQVPHKVVVNLILISHVLQDSVPNSREIWRKLCHLPKKSQRHRHLKISQVLMPCWDSLLRIFYDSFHQTLKCFSCRTYASNQQCKANWHKEAHLLTNPALRHSERIWEHLNTSFLHVFAMSMHFWNSWGSTVMSRTSHVILNGVNLIQH